MSDLDLGVIGIGVAGHALVYYSAVIYTYMYVVEYLFLKKVRTLEKVYKWKYKILPLLQIIYFNLIWPYFIKQRDVLVKLTDNMYK